MKCVIVSLLIRCFFSLVLIRSVTLDSRVRPNYHLLRGKRKKVSEYSEPNKKLEVEELEPY